MVANRLTCLSCYHDDSIATSVLRCVTGIEFQVNEGAVFCLRVALSVGTLTLACLRCMYNAGINRYNMLWWLCELLPSPSGPCSVRSWWLSRTGGRTLMSPRRLESSSLKVLHKYIYTCVYNRKLVESSFVTHCYRRCHSCRSRWRCPCCSWPTASPLRPPPLATAATTSCCSPLPHRWPLHLDPRRQG